VIQLSVKEALIASSTKSGNTDRDLEVNKLKQVLERCGVVITERKPCKVFGVHKTTRKIDAFTAEFSTRNIQDDLVKLLAPSSIPSTSSADASTLIRANDFSSVRSQLISLCYSSTVSACRSRGVIMPCIIPLSLL
jgi:DNA mismatch repair protein MSH2